MHRRAERLRKVDPSHHARWPRNAHRGVIWFSGRRSSDGPLTTIVWQDYALIPWRSVLDNVAFGLEILGVDKQSRKAEALRHL